MKICVMSSDGIGPEICQQALRVLRAPELGLRASFTEAAVGGAAYRSEGRTAPRYNVCGLDKITAATRTQITNRKDRACALKPLARVKAKRSAALEIARTADRFGVGAHAL